MVIRVLVMLTDLLFLPGSCSQTTAVSPVWVVRRLWLK